MTILIHGAAGGVGSFATQIARHAGARVVATASGADDINYLKSLGVEQIIDFQREPFEEKVHGVDGVVDLVGGEALARSYGVIKIKRGGVLATTVQPTRAMRRGLLSERNESESGNTSSRSRSADSAL